MAMVEGIGDEVLYFFTALVLIVVSAIAWISTNTTERPLLRTVLIVERHQPRVADASTSPATTQPESAPDKPPDIAGPVPSIDQEAHSSTSETSHESEDNLEDSTKIIKLMDREEKTAEEEKKDEVDSGPTIRINLKYLNDDLKRVEGSLEEQVGDFKKRHFSPELSAQNIVRLVFNGKLLGQDTLTLGSYGLHDNCVVHCLVHQQRAPTPTPSSSPAPSPSPPPTISHLALSNILLVILSVLLGVAWYGRYQYAQWYTATTTVALVGLTGIFTVFLIGIYIPDTTQT